MRRLLDSAPVRQSGPAPMSVRDRVLQYRPYLDYYLWPLAEYLTAAGYSDRQWSYACDWVDDGGLIESLVVDRLLGRSDLPAARRALECGRRRRAVRDQMRSAAIMPPELDPEDEPDDDQTEDSSRLDRRLRELAEGWEPRVVTPPEPPLPKGGSVHPEAPAADDYGRAVRDHHAALQVYLTLFPE